MSNSMAVLRYSVSYTGADGRHTSTTAVSCPYQAVNTGTVDAPALTAGAHTYAVPFGAVAEATLVVIKNRTGQDLDVKINGAAAASHSVPANGVLVLGGPTAPTETPIESVDLISTDAQVGAGAIDYHVFGDMI